MDTNEASSSLAFDVINMFLWSFVPEMLSKFLLQRYYGYKYARNSPHRPKPSSLRFKLHYRNCYTLVIGLYLVYSMCQTVYNTVTDDGGSYYRKVGVSRMRARDDLKRRTRQLLLQNHPDKNPSPNSRETYLQLKSIIDTMEKDNLYNVYEKYGPKGIETTQQKVTSKHYVSQDELRRDYVYMMMPLWVVHHLANLGMMAFSSLLGGSSKQQKESFIFWRLIGLLLLAAYEAYLYFIDFTTLDTVQEESTFKPLRPHTWPAFLLSPVPIFERIRFLRALLLNLGFAADRLGSLWFPPKARFSDDGTRLLDELDDLSAQLKDSVEADAEGLLKAQLQPFIDNNEMNALLLRQMGQVVADIRERSSSAPHAK